MRLRKTAGACAVRFKARVTRKLKRELKEVATGPLELFFHSMAEPPYPVSRGSSRPPWWLPLALGAALAGAGCGKETPAPSDSTVDNKALLGEWSDLSAAPETSPRQCCFFDSGAAAPCGPDTLILQADSSMIFTSVIDEPSQYWIAADTLYRIRGGNRDDVRKYPFTLSHDTLAFAVSPLCDQLHFPARYRKIP